MTAERADSQLVTVDDYLAGEEKTEVKHEYIGGVVYAMAGGKNAHHEIASNVLGILHAQLRGKPCRPYNSDTKVRVQYPTHTRFYYPDVMVVCSRNAPELQYQDHPVVIVEVASESTRRTDELEKRDAYLTIPTLRVYLLLDQVKPEAVVWRRGDQGFVREVHAGLEAVIALAEIEAQLPLAEAYEAVAMGG
jgi:Uma2 family endonuclease